MRISFHFPSHSLYIYRSSSNCALAFDAYMRHFVSFAGESVSLCFVHEAPTYSILSHSHISQQKRSLYILFLSLSSIHSISLCLPWNKKLFSFFSLYSFLYRNVFFFYFTWMLLYFEYAGIVNRQWSCMQYESISDLKTLFANSFFFQHALCIHAYRFECRTEREHFSTFML